MKQKRLLQTMFALCTAALLTTGCSNDVPTTNEGGNGATSMEASVSFTLGLPGGDEVDYTRATTTPPMQDATEWSVKKLKVYHFSSTEATPTDAQYALVAAYDVPVKESLASGESDMGYCVKTADAKYTLKLSIRSKVNASEKHVFAFIANDSCATFDTTVGEAFAAAQQSSITLEALKQCTADKQVTNNTADASLFMGNPEGLCMTAIKEVAKLDNGVNTISDVKLVRIMARMDVRNFVPESRNFKLLSVRMKYAKPWGATKASLFVGPDATISANAEDMDITQHAMYATHGYPATYAAATTEMKDTFVGASSSDGRTGVWYKKVMYMYEYPNTLNGNALPTPKAEISYTLNGSPATVEVDMKDVNSNTFNIARNKVYTLQVGETAAVGGAITFTFTDTPWTTHEMDGDLNSGK